MAAALFIFPSISITFRLPKPPNSLSSNASSFFLQNPFSAVSPTSQDTGDGSDTGAPSSREHTESVDNGKIKMPTAPWMKGPLLLSPDEVLDLSNPRKMKPISNGRVEKVDRALTDKVSGRMGEKAMKKIIGSLQKLPETKNLEDTQYNSDEFGSGFLWDYVEGDGGERFAKKKPWEREQRAVFRRVKREKVPTAAELSLDGELLERLRGEAVKMRRWVKVKKAGVTQAVVGEVHSIWANNELVMLKFGLPLCLNMDRAREIVELKTGGLVVWSKKDALVAYRGCRYQFRGRFRKGFPESMDGQGVSTSLPSHQRLQHKAASLGKSLVDEKMAREMSPWMLGNGNLGFQPIDRPLYEREAERLLDGLGPRFVDWWYPKPLPVDADMLPEVVPGFKPPFRLCLPDVQAKLTDYELTYLRKLARPLPTHFVLGSNTKLQGLAVAILKLWEKSIIAKIAVKWGVPNTKDELMASELKRLTGGVLILRNKFFIILYRGKNFLPAEVADLVMEKEQELQQWQLSEENARLKAAETLRLSDESEDTSTVGTLSEFQHIQTLSGDSDYRNSEDQLRLEAEKQKLEKELRKQEQKLFILKMKIKKSEKELIKLNSAWELSDLDPDKELITEEERECFRKIGLKMNRVLVLGRRGVFDGVIEGMHQHWKHREVVKVITMQKTYLQVTQTAIMLERETGGALVSIAKLKEGHAIIIYRGKNYRRPVKFGDNLLDKRKALQRSLEMQRIGSLRFFAYERERRISDLWLQLANLQRKEHDIRDSHDLVKSQK